MWIKMMFRNWMQIQTSFHIWKEDERGEYSREISVVELDHLLCYFKV